MHHCIDTLFSHSSVISMGDSFFTIKNLGNNIFAFFTFSAVAKDKDKQSFKLRAGMDKKIVIYVQQTSNKELAIER